MGLRKSLKRTSTVHLRSNQYILESDGDRLMLIPKNFDLQAELAKCKTANDLKGKNGLIQGLIG